MDEDNSLNSGCKGDDKEITDNHSDNVPLNEEQQPKPNLDEKKGTGEPEPFEAVIKLSPSDVEVSDSDDDEEDPEGLPESDEVLVKNEVESDDYDSSSIHSDNDNLSPSWNGLSEEEEKIVEELVSEMKSEEGKADQKKKVGVKRKEPVTQKPKRPRGRPKQPRRLIVPEGAPADYTSEEEEDSASKPVLRPGSGYPVDFKLKVLKYADSHSNAATAEKFGLQPKRIRDWKKSKYRIEAESQGGLKRRPRTDGYTVEEKLQAVAFATERSFDEARLLYNVDRRTIEKWKAKKEQLESRVLLGEGNFIRRGGSGRKPRFTQIEESLRDWIVTLRLKGVTVNYKMILNKAKMIMEEDISMQGSRVPTTRTWVIGFLKRQNLHGLLGTTLGHEDPQELLNSELKTKEDGDIKTLADKIIEIPENPNKRNRRTISLQDKVNIIKRIEQGETQGTVAKALKVATSTIQTIWSCRTEILHKYVNPKMKTKSDALLWKTYSSINAALHDWYEQNISKIGKVDCSMLMEKAVQLSETYRLPQFHTEAKHWLRIFCKKHSLPEVLAELRGNYAGPSISVPASTTNSHVAAPQQPHQVHLPVQITHNSNTAINSVDSSNHHHDDDFHTDFNLNDFLSVIHNTNDPHHQARHQNQSLPPPSSSHNHQPVSNSSHQTMPSHHNHLHNHPASPADSLNSQRFSTSSTCSTAAATPQPQQIVTTMDAVKYVSLLRQWIQSNYGPHEDVLNTHLSVIENAVVKNRMVEMAHSGGVHH